MHFTYTNVDGVFTIVAGFREEHGDRRVSERVQGDRTSIELHETTASFGVGLRHVDPDHFALAACLVFLPFIGQKVSFSVPVSNVIADFLSSPGMEQNVGHRIEVVTKVEQRQRSFSEITLQSSALALGGGFDAVAIKTLLPEVFAYHQVPTIALNHVYHYPAYKFYAQRDAIRFNGAPVCDAHIWTTVENIVRPRGVTTWATFALSSLLMAADRGINCLLSGTVFEGSFCNNGIKYHRFGTGAGSFINKAFQDVGLMIAPAATMMPEYVNAMQVFRSGLGDSVSFCIQSPAGGPCGKCMKCYRKRMLYEVNKRATGIRVPQFEALDIGRFDTPFIRKKTSEWPMYLSSSFKWMADKLPREMFVPSLNETVDALPNVGFGLDRMYPPGFDLLPPVIKSEMFERSRRTYDLMSEGEMSAVQNWDVTALPKPQRQVA